MGLIELIISVSHCAHRLWGPFEELCRIHLRNAFPVEDINAGAFIHPHSLLVEGFLWNSNSLFLFELCFWTALEEAALRKALEIVLRQKGTEMWKVHEVLSTWLKWESEVGGGPW